MTQNPWLALPTRAPFVLEEDKPYVGAFNSFDKRKGDHSIDTKSAPEPRLGPISSPIVILQLNPSRGDSDFNAAHSELKQLRWLQSAKDEGMPHLGITMRDSWWTPRFRSIIDEVGEETAATRICSIEFFPYASNNFAHGQIRLPSQRYTFDLVRSCIKRHALFVVTRNFGLWASAIPELRAGPRN